MCRTSWRIGQIGKENGEREGKGRLGTNLQRAVARIRGNRGLVKDADRHLRVRGLGAKLEVRVTKALSHGVDTDQGTRAEEVLTLEGARAHRVLLGPHAVHVLRKELRRGQLVTRVASRGGIGGAKLGRTLIRAEICKALLLLRLALQVSTRSGLRGIARGLHRVGRRNRIVEGLIRGTR